MNEHDAIGRIKRLSHSINCADEIAEVIERLIKERDEARRIACAYVSGTYRKDVVTLDRAAALAEAERRGWDCFPQEDGK